MKYGKTTLVCKKGFYIEPSLLRPIGIFEESNCWGVFAKRDERTGAKGLENDLIIAPFPYRSWACVVKLNVRIKDNDSVDTILSILEILDDNKINILSIQAIYSGYSHSILEMTLEISAVRNEIEAFKNTSDEVESIKGNPIPITTKDCLSNIFIKIYSIMEKPEFKS